jgi:quinol monooxygenase YgiN
MPFFVAVNQEIPTHALDRTLATIQADFATSRAIHPGRRHTRVFQRFNRPNHLLSIGEWEHPADYERLHRSPRYRELVVTADPPARIEPLTRLRYFARMAWRPSVVACVTLTGPAASADALRAFVLGDTQRRIERAPGLLSHELYQVDPTPGAMLAVHSWRSLADLDRFRTEDGPGYSAALAELGVVVKGFTGLIAAQFSRFEEPIAAVPSARATRLASQ